ncbi:hypothetical protein [Flavobacterium agrisoli]|uniref:Uncharacterized protein n=1 Tax=Flavobacterium agrisoli TaxID=2793066 RepID=A0A934PJV7_9FLAO|nr:hypothetical protein [Flavobacterium agrisoli]MBK0368665.1 hypothetical protein [Flavobacterium agrisoli]
MNSNILSEKFERIAQDVINEAEIYSFNIKDLPHINNYQTDIRSDLNFIEIFSELNKKIHNCLYWFEVETPDKCGKLKDLLDTNRENLKLNLRTVPSKNNNCNSNVLYVGIRRGGIRKRDQLSNIAGRISIHLGYYVKGSTQGLQLIHWSNKLDCVVKLHVVEFNDLPNDYLNTIEKIIAFKLKPLCGKH